MTNLQKQIHYWEKSADRNLATALFLYKGKRYDACLFLCHLSLEKLLKGLIVQHTKKAAPFLHDLATLA